MTGVSIKEPISGNLSESLGNVHHSQHLQEAPDLIRAANSGRSEERLWEIHLHRNERHRNGRSHRPVPRARSSRCSVKPHNLNTTSRSISLFWEVAHNGNSHITGSTIQYQTVSGKCNISSAFLHLTSAFPFYVHWNGQTSQLIVSGAENSASLRALTPMSLYFVRVIAENALGQSRPSAVINVTTDEEAPSAYPRDVQGTLQERNP
ncbi:hypothetical protein CEXT_95741 [Caerostris extrusa]|uniref:Fibronectin type-III domain-containing protein n=1 Tax=Caerostris extrusa TaxID=172846 RepID=A0AAV4U004_CAEEX|nr:hypothetical protein CEXT_95741 [Caerostris extrusa]